MSEQFKCLPSLITRRANPALLTGPQTSPVLVIPRPITHTVLTVLRYTKPLSNPYSDLLYRYLPCLHATKLSTAIANSDKGFAVLQTRIYLDQKFHSFFILVSPIKIQIFCESSQSLILSYSNVGNILRL